MYDYITIFLSIYLLKNTWVVHMLELIGIQTDVNIIVQAFYGYIIFISVGKMSNNGIASWQGRCRFDYIRNFQTTFQSGHTISQQ